ncbi:uncharacterized protein LOC131161758 [Malania oleifera]|uniref:uncharacterized protein LOC131161758 n=1 Tax=Malania oleifera TaxID=397392 RepID=UPI0025ADAE3B|nr:uncharacterized protein LOC131161758 [Malania oleifera]
MVTVCQTCGDEGYSNALVHCEKCQVTSQHRYCSEKLTFNEDVAWVCEGCVLNLDKPTPIPPRKSERINKKAYQAAQSKIKLRKRLKGISRSIAETEEQRYDGPCEVCEIVNFSEYALSTADYSLLNGKNYEGHSCEDNQMKDQELGTHRTLMQENQCNTNEKAESFKLKASQMPVGDSLDNSDQNIIVHAQPIIDPVWRGGFDIFDKNFGLVEGLVAHLSNKACLKVFEEASLFPALLCLEMLPRKDVWPKSFEISQPSDDNIALYFFPGNKMDERFYDRLVDDMISQELAMRAVVENAELLVFTSTELPLSYWRFHGKHYLWGVFRGNKASSDYQLHDPFSVQNSSGEQLALLNSVNNSGGRAGAKKFKKTKYWNTHSPLSPLCNGGEHERDMEPVEY